MAKGDMTTQTTKIIYMQSTIDNMINNHPGMINDVEAMGEPEVVELTDDKGEVNNKYYVIKIQTNNLIL